MTGNKATRFLVELLLFYAVVDVVFSAGRGNHFTYQVFMYLTEILNTTDSIVEHTTIYIVIECTCLVYYQIGLQTGPCNCIKRTMFSSGGTGMADSEQE